MAKTERGQRAYEDRHERAADELVGDLLIDVEVEVANGIHERLAAGIAALEQACAVTAVAERGGGAVEAWKLANGYDDLLKAYSEAVSASARRRELLSRVYMWRGSGLPSGLWRDLETELNGPKAEAGKAQAEGWQACRHRNLNVAHPIPVPAEPKPEDPDNDPDQMLNDGDPADE
jgi:hypothetical protein